MGVCDQEGVSVEQGHETSLPSWGLQEKQVDLLQNRVQLGYVAMVDTG